MPQPPPPEREPAEEPARDSGLPGGSTGAPGGGPQAPDRARDPRLAGFVQGGLGDTCPPGAALAAVVEDLSGPERRCDGATDDGLVGLLGRWDALEAWAAAGKLGVVRELIRRRARRGPGGYLPAHGDLPDQWHEGLAHEVSAALDLSIRGADKLTCFAWDLQARLPGTGAALAAGVISEWKAKLISDELAVLDDEHAAEAEKLILDQIAGQTPGVIGKLAAQAVCTVDPDGAAKRREHAEREEARVRFWRANGGACALAAYGLPTDAALAANAAIEDRAQRYKRLKARPDARLDQLRVLAFLDILNGITLETRLTQSRAEAAAQHDRTADAARQGGPAQHGPDGIPGSDGSPAEGAGSSAPDGGGNPASAPDSGGSDEDWDAYDWDSYFGDRGEAGGDPDSSSGDDLVGVPGPGVPDDDWFADQFGANRNRAGVVNNSGSGGPKGENPGGTGGSGGGNAGTAVAPPILPALAARANLTLPLATLLGMAERPGAGHALGPLDPALVRDLAVTAATNPNSEWCLTITNGEGIAVAHGCAKPARTDKTSPPPASRDGPPRTTWALTPRDEPGPPGGYGTWTLTLPGGRELAVKLLPIPVTGCDHRHESHGYQPNDTLRHLIQVRDGTCTFPTCSAHACESDFEHAVPYDQGGKTCACNGGARSRRCHRVKQSPGWTVTQPEPGLHQWTTPSGRTYTQGPMRYPA
jgi:hypothetical protein